MKKEEMQKLFKGIEQKIGKENYAKMSDDLGVLLTDNENMNNTIASKETKIKQLEDNNELLITANGNLLQQVGMGEEPTNNKNEEDTKPKFSLKDAFDEKGNFKK